MLKELEATLRIPFGTTIKFQSQKLTLSDVYGMWIGMQLHLKHCGTKRKFKTGLAKHLVDCLESRSEIIFKNPLMLCALTLDPRYRKAVIFNREKKEVAKETLMKIWRRIQAINTTHDESTAETSNNSTESFDFEFDMQAAISQHLDESTVRQQNAHNTSHFDIEMAIELFQPEVSMALNSSVLGFWESMKDAESQLHQLAMVVYSVPPTEVQVERDFSGLKFIFTERRCNLKQYRLEDILLIHFNADLFYEVNADQVNEIKNAI